jgi:hypothetical protein
MNAEYSEIDEYAFPDLIVELVDNGTLVDDANNTERVDITEIFTNTTTTILNLNFTTTVYDNSYFFFKCHIAWK